RAFLAALLTIAALVAVHRLLAQGTAAHFALRESLFNITSIMTGTGYASTNYQLWGAFPVTVFFLVGLIGGCAGSTSCSVKVFRYQILLKAVANQIRRIQSPHGVYQLKYAGRRLSEDVLSSVMVFLTMFLVTLGVVSVLLSATGLDLVTSVSGAATAIANVGPGLGTMIGPDGNFAGLSVAAKWILLSAMLVGRLELLVVFVLFTSRFWRA
ncbi:MAG: potassium transporter TrkH, partial [Boseongicola sp.]|nr:potassium transporter TrkH [Boseongicola sp.]